MLSEREDVKKELNKALESGVGSSVTKVFLALLGGIPIAGSIIGAGSAAWSEYEQNQFKKILTSWLKLQEDEIQEIGHTLVEIMMRIDRNDENVQKRIESPEYLSLVKKCFRDWSAAESEEKRILIRNLLSNAAGGEKICGDDVIRLFIEWIEHYSEGHFRIIKEIYKKPGITRHEIWLNIYTDKVREDSAEADLFRLLINDLSLGRVIRQHREKDYQGNFLKAKPQKNSNSSSKIMTSAFDDNKEYELTELGRWFVHYTMNEIVPKITSGDS